MSNPYHVPDLGRLIRLMDRVVQEQAGEKVAMAVSDVRRVSEERRAGLPGEEAKLTGLLDSLGDDALRDVMRALSLFFDLANLAEDRQRVRKLRERSLAAAEADRPAGESIAGAVAAWAESGLTADAVRERLGRLTVEPVFTAHPSEAKRRTTREILRALRNDLAADASDQRLLADLTALWQSDLVRPQRPSVGAEVDRGLFFARVLWDVVPTVYRDLRAALQKYFPGGTFEIPPFLRFGTWIGGDRDGHPDVTARVTAETFGILRREAIRAHRTKCRDLMTVLVSSTQQAGVSEPIGSLLAERIAAHPQLAGRIDDLSTHELLRRWLRQIEFRLDQTEADAAGGYESAAELSADIDVLRQQLNAGRGERLAELAVQPWLDQTAAFGLHFAAMDIRQNSETHDTARNEVFAALGLEGEDALRERPRTGGDLTGLSSTTGEVMQTFAMLADVVRRGGLRPVGAYVISMTHRVEDVLTVLWFWRRAWAEVASETPVPPLPIAPLLETIDDLQNGADLLDRLLSDPTYREHLDDSAVDGGRPHQMVMVGYSDSTKDGGYLAAVWCLHQAQERLAEVAERHGVDLTIFHGRGGALGRGGGPAARAIQSLPPRAVRGRLRVTEQGEVLAERYDDPDIAHRHLEQITHATMRASGDEADDTPAEWVEAMQEMSAASLKRYRSLVEHPQFLTYFDLATPIGEIETLPIGSRPSRRKDRRTLSDLRAIPWTFAWTQSRHLLPAWFGLGTGLSRWASGDGSWDVLREMYEQWPMFTALIDNADLALAKADLDIALRYAELAGDDARGVWDLVAEEFRSSRAAVLLTTGEHELLAHTDWLRRSILERNPSVDPLNLAQVMLLRRKRAAEPESADAHTSSDLLRLAIQGVAAGLRSTG